MSFFKRKTHNGEKVVRSWLCYSPSKGSVFCFFCKLLSDSNISLTDTGYYDWRHAQQYFIGHEQSVNHIQAVSDALIRAQKNNRVDHKLQQ